ncbi:MAG: hypothetical protein LBS27_01795 [Bifidobacteriaceae bacterium]|jgi:hypothetical protein|nr:hypothetical protein [Bifidobacteriaceae bacterium]
MKLRGALALGAGLATAGIAIVGPRLHSGWGATPHERSAPLPGDELVPSPVFHSTRAITIQAPPESVWPWLVQMGTGRAGWYSYDALISQFSSAPTISASTIIQDFQDLKADDVIDLIDSMVFHVHEIEPNRAIVLLADEHQLPLQPWVKSWTFVIKPIEGGATRLLVRERSYWTLKWVGFVTAFTNWLWFWVTRRQLINLKALVEAT